MSILSKPAVGRFGIERHPYTKSRIDQVTTPLKPLNWLHRNYTSKWSILR